MIRAQARSFIVSPLGTHRSSSGSKLGSGFGAFAFDCSAFIFFSLSLFFLLKACSEVGLSKMDTRGGGKRVNDVVSRRREGELEYNAASEHEKWCDEMTKE